MPNANLSMRLSRALLAAATVLLLHGGVAAAPTVGQSADYPFEPVTPVWYAANCCNAWVEGRILDAAGQPVNGALVKVRGRDGWETVSRPSGGEARPSPAGVYVITLRSGPEQLMDYAWTLWMVDANGQPLSVPTEVFTDRDPGAADSRQVIHLDFQGR